MNEIRVTYSGLISFAVGLTSVITGIVFTLIVTRQLSPNELGVWTLVGGLMTYVIIMESSVSYWTTREIARGIDSGKTALFSSGIFSMVAVGIYMLLVYLVGHNSKIDQSVLILASILIPVVFLNRVLTAINFGSRPHTSSYGFLFFEFAKIPAGLVLVYFLHLGVSGAIVSTTIAYLVSTIVLAIYAKDKINGKIKIDFIQKWLKLSWVSLYPEIPGFLNKLDVLIFTLMTGSVLGLAYFTAATTIASLVQQSGSISNAIYPKLLESDQREHMKENLMRLFYFMIPLSMLSITFVKPALFALNPLYVIAVPITIVITVRTFFNTLTGVFYPALTAIEKVDMNEKSTFGDYVKSKLFFLPTVFIIQNAIYLILLSCGLYIISTHTSSQLDFTTYWAIVLAITEAPFTIYLGNEIRKNFSLKLDYWTIIKYLLTSIFAFGIVYVMMNQVLIYKKSIFEFLPDLLLFVMIGISIYFVITYFTDKRTKNLVKSITHELRRRF